MPNGESKNWMRFLNTIIGFRATYGQWPGDAEIPDWFDAELRELMTLSDYDQLQTRLPMKPLARSCFVCRGGTDTFEYGVDEYDGEEDFFPVVMEWLGVSEPDYED